VEELFPASIQKVATTVDLPLSHQAARVLEMAAEEAKRRHSESIEPRHLLWGLFQDGGPEVASMQAFGLDVEAVNRDLDRIAVETNLIERNKLRRMIDHLPQDRLDAAAVLLTGLTGDRFEASGTGPAGPFRFVFGSEPGPA
jgi:hypothetical protein